MEVAADWLAENPEPDATMIRIPGASARKARAEAGLEFESWVVQKRGMLSRRPDLAVTIAPKLSEVERLLGERSLIDAELDAAESKPEAMINRSWRPNNNKHDSAIRESSNVDLGRWALSWARSGYNVIDLSPNFTAAMLLTDHTEIDLSEVRLPFPALLMLIPDGFARGAEGLDYTKIHVSEATRSVLNQLEVGEEVMRTIESMPRDSVMNVVNKIDATLTKSGGILTPRTLLGTPVAAMSPGRRHGALSATMADDGSALHIYATDGAHVLETFVDRRDLTWEALDGLPDTVAADADIEARHTLRRIVFGALAFIAAMGSSMERRSAPSGRRRVQPVRAESPAVWDVGRTVRLGPSLIREARSGARQVALRIKHRHIVRGHYRNQPYGHGRQERKRIWIAPFWKGPEDGAAIVHTYKPAMPDADK